MLLDHTIKIIRLDNVGEFISKLFDGLLHFSQDWYKKLSTTCTYSKKISRIDIKRLTRTLLLQTQLPSSTWGHVILHDTILTSLRPTDYH